MSSAAGTILPVVSLLTDWSRTVADPGSVSKYPPSFFSSEGEIFVFQKNLLNGHTATFVYIVRSLRKQQQQNQPRAFDEFTFFSFSFLFIETESKVY